MNLPTNPVRDYLSLKVDKLTQVTTSKLSISYGEKEFKPIYRTATILKIGPKVKALGLVPGAKVFFSAKYMARAGFHLAENITYITEPELLGILPPDKDLSIYGY